MPLGRLHMRPLQWYLKTHWRYPQSLDIPIPASQVLRDHLQWWTYLPNLRMEGAQFPSVHRCFSKRMVCSLKALNSQWSVESSGVKVSHKHSRTKSSVSSFKIIQKSASESKSTDFHHVYLNRQGGTHSQEMYALIWRLMAWTNARGIQIRVNTFQGISMFSQISCPEEKTCSN